MNCARGTSWGQLVRSRRAPRCGAAASHLRQHPLFDHMRRHTTTDVADHLGAHAFRSSRARTRRGQGGARRVARHRRTRRRRSRPTWAGGFGHSPGTAERSREQVRPAVACVARGALVGPDRRGVAKSVRRRAPAVRGNDPHGAARARGGLQRRDPVSHSPRRVRSSRAPGHPPGGTWLEPPTGRDQVAVECRSWLAEPTR